MRKSILFLMIITAVMTLTAQYDVAGENDVVDNVLTLGDALDMAMRYNKDYISAMHSYTASEYSEKQSISNFFPSISYSTSMRHLDEEPQSENPITGEIIRGDQTTFSKGISASMPIYNGGRNWYSKDISSYSRQSSLYNLEKTKQDVIYSVYESYLGIISTKKLIEINTKSLQSATNSLEKSRIEKELGKRTDTEVLRWEIEVNTKEIELLDYQNKLELQIQGLKNLIDYRDDIIEIADTIDMEMLDYEKYMHFDAEQKQSMYSTLEELAVYNNYSIKMMNKTRQIQSRMVSMSWGNFLPSINASFSYGWATNDEIMPSGDASWSAGISFSLPIFSSFSDYYGLQEAKYNYRKTNMEYKNVVDGQKIAVNSAFQNFILNAKKIHLNERSLQSSKENYDKTRAEYELQKKTVDELLDAEILYNLSEINLLTSKHDYILAKLKLLHLVNSGESVIEPEGY